MYAERAEAAAVLCGTMPVLSVHHFSGNSKTRYKKLFTHVESHASAVSLLESREWRYIYIKAINNYYLRIIAMFYVRMVLATAVSATLWILSGLIYGMC